MNETYSFYYLHYHEILLLKFEGVILTSYFEANLNWIGVAAHIFKLRLVARRKRRLSVYRNMPRTTVVAK
jgi:hypothetical protein